MKKFVVSVKIINVSRHTFLIWTCCSRELSNFPLSTFVCLSMLLPSLPGCRPDLSVKGKAVSSNISRETFLWCPLTGQAVDTRFLPCVSMLQCLIRLENIICTQAQTIGCLAALRNTGLFSNSIHCPPAVTWSCSAPKETKCKSLSAPAWLGHWLQVRAWYKTKGGFWLMCLIWGPIDSHAEHLRIHSSLWLSKIWGYWFGSKGNGELTILSLGGSSAWQE